MKVIEQQDRRNSSSSESSSSDDDVIVEEPVPRKKKKANAPKAKSMEPKPMVFSSGSDLDEVSLRQRH